MDLLIGLIGHNCTGNSYEPWIGLPLGKIGSITHSPEKMRWKVKEAWHLGDGLLYQGCWMFSSWN